MKKIFSLFFFLFVFGGLNLPRAQADWFFDPRDGGSDRTYVDPPPPPPTVTESIPWFSQRADDHCTPTIQEIADPQACKGQQDICKGVYWKCLADNGCSAQGQVYTCPQGVYKICESWPYKDLLEPRCKEKTPDSIVEDAVFYFCGDFKKLGLEECDEGPNGGLTCTKDCKKKVFLLPMVNINKLQLPNPNPISPTDPITPNDSDADTDKGDKNLDPDSADSKQGVIVAKGEPVDGKSSVSALFACTPQDTGVKTSRAEIGFYLIGGMLPLVGRKIRRVRRGR